MPRFNRPVLVIIDDLDDEYVTDNLTAADHERLAAMKFPELTGEFYVLKGHYEYVAVGRPRYSQQHGRLVQDSHWVLTHWTVLGIVTSISDAKKQGFIAPILEDVTSYDADRKKELLESAVNNLYTRR